jgi:hypothetical protein
MLSKRKIFFASLLSELNCELHCDRLAFLEGTNQNSVGEIPARNSRIVWERTFTDLFHSS